MSGDIYIVINLGRYGTELQISGGYIVSKYKIQKILASNLILWAFIRIVSLILL